PEPADRGPSPTVQRFSASRPRCRAAAQPASEVSTNAEVDTPSKLVVMDAIIARTRRRPEGAVHRTLTADPLLPAVSQRADRRRAERRRGDHGGAGAGRDL